MAGESGGVSAGDDSGISSPKNKFKVFCSHGGKILPRTGDGLLKYVGGESRVIGVPRDITLSDFMKKVTPLTGRDMIFKYQLVPEDLDTLVTVRSDADLQHMFDEHDRPEQRYVDAINGIIHINPRGRPVRVVSSACSSPKNSSSSMHRVRSSPSFSSLTTFQGSLNSPKYQHSCYHHHHPHGHPYVRLSPDPPAGFGFGRPQPVLSLPRQDSGRVSGFNMYYSPTRSNGSKGSSGLPSPCGHHRFDRSSSSPRSPNPNPIWE
ncbi:hypothetical protein K1719_021638 [Acacia pycnantha]|nr:hypothetical protein K1719_021638 [Acacia pycnantha]